MRPAPAAAGCEVDMVTATVHHKEEGPPGTGSKVWR
jgi:hypothetical protein